MMKKLIIRLLFAGAILAVMGINVVLHHEIDNQYISLNMKKVIPIANAESNDPNDHVMISYTCWCGEKIGKCYPQSGSDCCVSCQPLCGEVC